MLKAALGKSVKFQSLAIRFKIRSKTITRQARGVDSIVLPVFSDAVNEGAGLLKERGIIL